MLMSVSYTHLDVYKRQVPIREQSREFVCSLRDYFEKEKEHGGPLISVSQVVNRTAAALSISKNTAVSYTHLDVYKRQL